MAPTSLVPGAVFAGEYRVIRKLSEGGMGAVYVVEQASTGQRRALKVMQPWLVQRADLRARFELEAKVSGSVPSEHVVHVLAAGIDGPTGMPWLTMELLEGEDLAHALERAGRMTPAQVYGIFFQLCHALEAAHAAGIIHRDLKPENVFLAVSRRADVPYTVKVLDFGIAKVTAEAQTVNTGAAGTPLYMAPEQTSAGSAISPSTDVWALGLIAFRMLTGRSYWRGGNVVEVTPMMILRETLMEPLVRGSARAGELGALPLPEGFDDWFARCVARDPAARFRDAGEVFRALAPALGVERASLHGGRPDEAVRGARDSLPGPATAVASTGPTPPGVVVSHDDLEERDPERAKKRSSSPVVLGVAFAGLAGAALLFVLRAAPASVGAARAGEDATECPRDMALVAGGSFTPAELATLATVKPFCLDLSEVTARAYGACAAGGKCSTDGVHCSPSSTYGKPGRELHPMNCVTWEQAEAHCRARGARLPAEVEWEWAARGGARAEAFPWGNDEPGEQLCWSGLRPREETCEVGAFSPGDTHEHVRDLAGNVVEWTASRYDTETPARVYRGGSFADKERAVVRAGARNRASPTKRGELLGFRCAADPTVQRDDRGAPF